MPRPPAATVPSTSSALASLTRIALRSDGFSAAGSVDLIGTPGIAGLVERIEALVSACVSHVAPTAAWSTTSVEAKTFAPGFNGRCQFDGECIARTDTGETWQVRVTAATSSAIASATLTGVRTFAAVAARRPEPVPALREIDQRRSATAEDKRDRIAAAAVDVIASKGFANATIREIADAAKLHVPTLYQYIASKEDLLELVYTWSMDRVHIDLAAATSDCATVADEVTTVVRAMVRSTMRNRRRVGILNRELRSLPPAARQRVLARYRTLLDEIADIVARGVATGELAPIDPRIAANIIDALTDMPALRPFALSDIGQSEIENALATFIARGFGCKPQRPRRRQG